MKPGDNFFLNLGVTLNNSKKNKKKKEEEETDWLYPEDNYIL
jgi:hypothetical protein